MIRINLLQGPRTRKVSGQVDVRVEAGIGLILLVLVVGGCFYYSGDLSDQIAAKQQQDAEKRKQIKSLKEQVKKVEDFERKKKALEAKSRVIEELDKARSGPVKALDLISQSLDPLKLWLVRLNVKGKNIQVEGEALENDDVVGFVNNLRLGGEFENINLGEIRAKQSGSKKVKYFQFKLTMGIKG